MDTQDIGKLLEEHTNRISQQIDSLERRLDSLEHRLDSLHENISLFNDQIAFLRSIAVGEKGPKPVEHVPGGYGFIEPRTEWRQERPYRR